MLIFFSWEKYPLGRARERFENFHQKSPERHQVHKISRYAYISK